MNVVGLMSTYKEGRLARAAVDSIKRVELDKLYIYEGPAGEPLDADVPDTDPGELHREVDSGAVHWHEARWRTDARKRDEMLQRAKRDFPGVLWGIILDGDEVLGNGEYMRDRLQAVLWEDEHRGASVALPDNPPLARWPLRLIEADGAISYITARVVRLDLVRSIDISSSVITNISGIQEGWGNYQEMSAMWIEMWLHSIDNGKMIAWPPLPCEPYIVHRSSLRHPLRRGLRMSAQETEEFARAQDELTNGKG